MNHSSSFNVCTLGHDQVDEFLRFEDAYSLEGALVFAEVWQVFSLGIPIPATPLRVPDGVAEQPILVSLLCYVLKICHHCAYSVPMLPMLLLFLLAYFPTKMRNSSNPILSYPSELPPFFLTSNSLESQWGVESELQSLYKHFMKFKAQPMEAADGTWKSIGWQKDNTWNFWWIW